MKRLQLHSRMEYISLVCFILLWRAMSINFIKHFIQFVYIILIFILNKLSGGFKESISLITIHLTVVSLLVPCGLLTLSCPANHIISYHQV